MSCKFPFLRKSLLSSLGIAGLSALWITGFGFAVVPAFAQAPAGALYQVGVLPPDAKPVIPPGDDVIIYIHGGPGSRLEEASDLVNPLIKAGLDKNKRYAIISFDQLSQGYSSMIEPACFIPQLGGSAPPTPPCPHVHSASPVAESLDDHFPDYGGFPPTDVNIYKNGYFHGGPRPRLEGASDLINPLRNAGLSIDKGYKIVSFDQRNRGYSSMAFPASIVGGNTALDLATGAPAPTPPDPQPQVAFPVSVSRKDYFTDCYAPATALGATICPTGDIGANMTTEVTITKNGDGSGHLHATTETQSTSPVYGFNGAVAVAVLDKNRSLLWVSHTEVHGVNANGGHLLDPWDDTIPADKLPYSYYIAIIQKWAKKDLFQDINSWLRNLKDDWAELGQIAQNFGQVVNNVAGSYGKDDYNFLLAFSEESIVAFVNELDKIVPIKNRNIFILGGSTGGALALRMGHRTEPWIKKIVAWNPASVWSTYRDADPQKAIALAVGFTRSEAPEDSGSRDEYFNSVFGMPTNETQPNPEEWYRGDRDHYAGNTNSLEIKRPFRAEWSCNKVPAIKWDYIASARLEQQEIYNQVHRRWHWRLGTEMLLFSFFNDEWVGPVKLVSINLSNSGQSPNYLGIRKPTLLVAGDDDDWNIGETLGAPRHWENRWSRVHEMAPKMRNTPLSTLYLPNTGHSIHNERPKLFADQIVQFLTGGVLKTAFDQNLADELEPGCQPQLPQFPAIPQDLLAIPDSAKFLMEPAIVKGNFSNGSSAGTYSLRLRPELRAVAQAKNPANALGAAAARYYTGDTVWGKAFADLAVTGRDAYSAFRMHQPTDAQIAAAAHNFLPSAAGIQLVKAITDARTRAYQVAWALRNPKPEEAYQLRSTLGWIAVSGEDDPPDRPVNVPSGIPIFKADGKTQVSAYPQYDLPITMCPSTSAPYVPHECSPGTAGSVPFRIRYTIASLPEARPGVVVSAGPIITGVSPARGPITGGTLVHVSLARGSATNASVTFGSVTPPQARCDNENCWFTTPANAKPGQVDIVVAAQGASAIVPRVSSKSSPFTYTPNAELAGFGHDSSSTDPAQYLVSLDGNAPLSGAIVELKSKNPNVVGVPQAVTVRGFGALVPLTISPVPKDETVTITATYESKFVSVDVPAPAWPPIRIDPANVKARFAIEANVTITLPTLAPSGGTAVALQWSDPTAFLQPLPKSVIVPAGSYSTTFKVTASKPSVRTTGMPVLKQITLTATPANGTPVSVSTSVPFLVPLRPPGGPNGTRQY